MCGELRGPEGSDELRGENKRLEKERDEGGWKYVGLRKNSEEKVKPHPNARPEGMLEKKEALIFKH